MRHDSFPLSMEVWISLSEYRWPESGECVVVGSLQKVPALNGTVDVFNGRLIGDEYLVRSNTDDRTISLMKCQYPLVKLSLAESDQFPKRCRGSPKRSGNLGQRGGVPLIRHVDDD